MKKFFTAIPLQPEGKLLSQVYQSMGNQKLQCNVPIAFPILAAVNGYTEPGEEIRVIAVVMDNNNSKHNLGIFQESLDEICRNGDIHCPHGVETIIVPDDERVAIHIATFQKLIDFVEDDDELFACMTFGTKPLSQAMQLAVQYAYRVKSNASISCIVYGKVDHIHQTASVYDMTALVKMDEIVHLLAERGVQDPKAAIDRLMSL